MQLEESTQVSFDETHQCGLLFAFCYNQKLKTTSTIDAFVSTKCLLSLTVALMVPCQNQSFE
jgi:hypothetical protein